MSELTPNEMAPMLPLLAEEAQRYQNYEQQAMAYKRAVAILKGPDEPFLANIEDLTLDQKIKAAEKILSSLKVAKREIDSATSAA